MTTKQLENKIKIDMKDFEAKKNLLEEVKKLQRKNVNRDSLSNIS